MKFCCKCNQPATLKESNEVYCTKHYVQYVLRGAVTEINGKTKVVGIKAA